MDKPVKIETLNREDAVALWEEGKDAWNEWVEENPVYNIDFSDHVFDKPKIIDGRKVFDFEEFEFPDGNLSFLRAQFGEGGVNFSSAQFGEGDVNFSSVQFGEGNVDFSFAQFGEANVDFSFAQFGEGDVGFFEAQFGEGNVGFSYAQFGKGDVDFSEAQFGEGNVNFLSTQFGEGDVFFSDAQFGEGNVYFSHAQFGKGNVSFDAAQFGEGDVNFSSAQFGEGYMGFWRTQFGKGDVSFYGAQFGEGHVNFSRANFIKGNADFSETQFNKANVSFSYAIFEEVEVNFFDAKFHGDKTQFKGTQFKDGDVNFCKTEFSGNKTSFTKSTFDTCNVKFDNSKFSSDTINFVETNFGSGNIYFYKTEFEGVVRFLSTVFSECKRVEFRESSIKNSCTFNGNHFLNLSFYGAKIHDTFTFINTSMKTPPDLRGTEIKHHLVINNLNIEGFDPKDEESASKLQRLKEIAIDSKYHEGEQNFFALEQQALRTIEKSRAKRWLSKLYEVFSDYGRSIIKPFEGLICVWLYFSIFYSWLSLNNSPSSIWSHFVNANIFSMSQLLPFVSWSRSAKLKSSELLYGENIPPLVHYIATIEGLLAMIFIFLIGLGIRNRFRL